jgi:nucleoside-diphosphate-sugar epimerase
MKSKHYLVTGGSGFIGSHLVKALVAHGHRITILDDNSRGRLHRIEPVIDKVKMIEGDIRKAADVSAALEGVDGVIHLAFINGTEFFYTKPDLVLEVGVKGITNILDGCLKHGVRELILASSSEVYHLAPRVPADESVPLVIPDPMNPRYSYSAGKIISEMMAINYGRRSFERVLIFRPHNVFGPDMGWEHVIPQFALRVGELARQSEGPLAFPIQGDGLDTRAFIYIDDFVDGFKMMLEKGEHLSIYHIGTMEEISIAELARKVGAVYGREIEVVPCPRKEGGTSRRCPDIAKLRALGFTPRFTLDQALPDVVRWYDRNRGESK